MRSEKLAIVRLPSKSFPRALRMKKNLGKVDLAKALIQHHNYCEALIQLGFKLTILLPADHYPDGVFVEDPAIIIGDVLVITSLRRKKRQGEEKLLCKTLRPFFSKSKVFHINPPAYVEGGDVLVTDNRLFIGLSKRTNERGAEELTQIAYDNCSFRSHIFKIPDSYLHLKGGVSYHERELLPSGRFIAASEEIISNFSGHGGYKLVEIPAEERFGANGISNKGQIIICAGRPKSKKIFQRIGFSVREVGMSEFEKVDGAPSCLSKIF